MEFLESLKTHTDNIKTFNNAFTVKVYETFTLEVLKDTKNLKLKLDLVTEEINEYLQAVKTNDIIEIRDAISDILYVTIGYFLYLGKDIISIYEEFCRNNSFETKEYDDTFNIIYDKLSLEVLKNKDLVENISTILNKYLKQLQKSTKEKNPMVIVNSLCHLLFITYSIGKCFGIDVNSDFDIVHKSNMSKICASEEEAQNTMMKYKNDARYPETYYVRNDFGYVVRNKANNKVLKSINYTPAKFN